MQEQKEDYREGCGKPPIQHDAGDRSEMMRLPQQSRADSGAQDREARDEAGNGSPGAG
jgi:hypothetical protein